MNQFYRLLLVLFLSSITGISYAQDGQQAPRRYGSVLYNLTQWLENPEVKTERSAYERSLPRFTDHTSLETVTLPIVFHVLTPLLSTPVEEERIQAQIDQLNLAFNTLRDAPEGVSEELAERFKDVRANPQIEFCRPSLNPLGIPTSGIQYKTLPTQILASLDLIKQDLLGLTPWNTSSYLNIWISPLNDSIAGFAQLPGGIPGLDGIVIDPRYLTDLNADEESPYREGNTLVHLVGTYLGLQPLWGEGNCSDDGVADTPIHNEPNYGSPMLGHVSTCYGYPIEMSVNYMDNTDDAYTYFFTQGQVNRMRHTLAENGPRFGLTGLFTCTADQKVVLLNEEPASDTPPAEAADVTLAISPNPSDGLFQVVPQGLPTKSGILSIISMDGRVIHRVSILEGSNIELDMREFGSGIYFARLESGQANLTKKLIVR